MLDLKATICCLLANEVCKKAAILAISSAAATNQYNVSQGWDFKCVWGRN